MESGVRQAGGVVYLASWSASEGLAGVSLADRIQQHRFGRDLEASHVRTLSECAQARAVVAGGLLWRQGELRTACFLIEQGRVLLEIHIPGQGAISLDTVREGDMLGWSGLFESERWHYDARAITAVKIIAFDALALRDRCAQDHEFGYQLLKRCVPLLAARLDAARAKLVELLGR
jgi:CRP-like cAMP-binding protein